LQLFAKSGIIVTVNPSLASTVMRPRTKRLAPDVWIVREQASYEIFEAAPSFESIRTWSFDRYRFAEAQSDSQLLFIP
jgi:hypothetical protein